MVLSYQDNVCDVFLFSSTAFMLRAMYNIPRSGLSLINFITSGLSLHYGNLLC